MPPTPPLRASRAPAPRNGKRAGSARGAGWGWFQGLAGTALAFTPELLLNLAALVIGETDSPTTRVTAASAAFLVATSAVFYGWDLFAAWLFSLRPAAADLAAWGFRRPSAAYFWTIPAALASVYVVSFAHDIFIHPPEQDIVSQFPHSAAGLVLFVVLAVVMAPLCEEILFRGFLFRAFANSWGWGWGAAASAAVFALAHLQLSVFVPLFALGFALAWVYRRTGSLWTSISLHAVFNAMSVLAWYLTG